MTPENAGEAVPKINQAYGNVFQMGQLSIGLVVPSLWWTPL